jgi:hypothetical protein
VRGLSFSTLVKGAKGDPGLPTAAGIWALQTDGRSSFLALTGSRATYMLPMESKHTRALAAFLYDG